MDTEQNNQTEMEAKELLSNQCSPCLENHERVKAAKYCMECRDYYCHTCVDRHTWFPTLRNHTLYGAEDRAGTHIPGMSVIKSMCDVHTSETIDAYCPQHDDVLCAKCLKENHSSCTNVIKFAETANDSPRSLEMKEVVAESLEVGQRLHETVVTLNEELQHFNNSKDVAIRGIRAYRGELELTLLQLEGRSIDHVKDVHDKLANALLNERESVENHEYALQSVRFQHEVPFVSPEQQFIALHQQKKKLAKAKEALNSMTRAGRFEVKFTADSGIRSFLRGKLSLGEIEAVKKTHYTLSDIQKLHVKIANIDQRACNVLSSCISLDGFYLLIADHNNNSVKRFDVHTFRFRDHCQLPNPMVGMCCINRDEAAVNIWHKGIYVLSLDGPMRITRIIDQCHDDYDIAFCNGKLFATCYRDKICMYQLGGQLLKTITTDGSGNKIFFNTRKIEADEKEDRIYVTDARKGLVILNTNGEHIATVSHPGLEYPLGICTDEKGCAFVCGYNSKNIFQYNKHIGKLFELVKSSANHYIGTPQSLCYVESSGRKCIISIPHYSDYVYRCFLH